MGGSSLGNPGTTGVGGLVRDVSGSWLLGFYGRIGYSGILEAELMTIL